MTPKQAKRIEAGACVICCCYVTALTVISALAIAYENQLMLHLAQFFLTTPFLLLGVYQTFGFLPTAITILRSR